MTNKQTENTDKHRQEDRKQTRKHRDAEIIKQKDK